MSSFTHPGSAGRGISLAWLGDAGPRSTSRTNPRTMFGGGTFTFGAGAPTPAPAPAAAKPAFTFGAGAPAPAPAASAPFSFGSGGAAPAPAPAASTPVFTFGAATGDDVLLVDLRVPRFDGSQPVDADRQRILDAARLFPRAEPRRIIAHLAARGFPEEWTAPRVPRFLASHDRGSLIIMAAVGDLPPRQGEQMPPDFQQSLMTTDVRDIREKKALLSETSLIGTSHVRSSKDRHQCAHCGKADDGTLKKCTACSQVLYCGRECQKAHWKAHKSECKKRRELAASIDKLSADYADTGMNFKGKDVLKRLSATCLDQMPTAEQMALFGERLQEFKRVCVYSGALGASIYSQRCDKFSDDFGDPPEVVRQKGLAGTRNIAIYVHREDFLNYLSGGDGLAYDRYDEADLTSLAAMDPLRYANMLKLCKQGWTHEAFDPSAYFVCGFTDRSISPMADSSFLCPFETGT